MPVSKNTAESEETTSQKGPHRVFGIKDASQLPTKRTINLCIREKQSMSVEMFLIILAVILAVFIIVELVGVFIPYTKVERLEAELASAQSVLDEKQDRLKDYNEVQEYYNQYNYEGFDRSLADRLDVLGILERTILNNDEFKTLAKIRSINIQDKTVSLALDGLNAAQLSKLHKNMLLEPLVEKVDVKTSATPDSGLPTANLEISLKDASTVTGEGNV